MSQREQMILMCYKMAIVNIESYIEKNCNIDTKDSVEGVIYELDDAIRNIETKINIGV